MVTPVVFTDLSKSKTKFFGVCEPNNLRKLIIICLERFCTNESYPEDDSTWEMSLSNSWTLIKKKHKMWIRVMTVMRGMLWMRVVLWTRVMSWRSVMWIRTNHFTNRRVFLFGRFISEKKKERKKLFACFPKKYQCQGLNMNQFCTLLMWKKIKIYLLAIGNLFTFDIFQNDFRFGKSFQYLSLIVT